MHKYEIVLFWRDEDQAIVAVVPELHGCSAVGKDHETALRNVKEVMGHWLAWAKELGDPIPEPKGDSVLLATTESVKAAVPA